MKYLLYILLFATICSQSVTITSKITDENENPIDGVHIYLDNHGTITDIDGNFSLTVPYHGVVTISHIRYEEIKIKSSSINDLITLRADIIKANEVIVNSSISPSSLHGTASSTTIFSRNAIRKSTGSHLDYLTHNISNLLFCGGSSRARYFQIRGIGERSQYTGETPPNFSVGYMIDGIDFSGIGMMGYLFDTKQIEVFKGPQSSIFGPNAVAGLINITTNEPTPFYESTQSITMGSDNIKTFSFANSMPIAPSLLFRFAIQQHSQDGFRINKFTNSDTTNQRSEMFYRGKLHWLISSFLDAKLTYFFSNIDNNYDVWTVDNNEDLFTYTDRMGEDDQKTLATAIKLNANFIESIGLAGYYQYTTSEHNIINSFDGDWGNNLMWENDFSFDPTSEGYDYDFFNHTARLRQSDTHELRIHNNPSNRLSIVLGLYSSLINEFDDAEGYLFGGDATNVDCTFDITNTALYTQATYMLKPTTTLLLNMRTEKQTMNYNGTSLNYGEELPYVSLNTENSHFGGKIALINQLNESASRSISISRGFKAGGINQNPYLSDGSRLYNPESNINLEISYTLSNESTYANIVAFYMLRNEQQVQISSQQDPGDPNSFYYFTANAGNGYNMGAEIALTKAITSNLMLNTSLGMLKTHVDEYLFDSGEESVAMGNREQAMAPNYNYSIGLKYKHETGLFTKINYNGRSSYYYSDSHDQTADAYSLCDIDIGYKKGKTTLTLWGKNVLDTRYSTRGFYFGIEPPNYDDKLYVHYGDPLHFGITVTYDY